jgi:hypothetical protein
MDTSWHFPFFVLASLAVFAWLIAFSTRKRQARPKATTVMWVSLIVVVGGMLFARFGASTGLPWWIYYTVPALLTLSLPPVVFRFNRSEATQYIVLAFLSSPVIHFMFSFFLDWHEYMPFIPVPSLQSLLASSGAA